MTTLIEPIEIAAGHLRRTTADAPQSFALWLIAENSVELRLDDGEVLTVQIDGLAGHEIAEAIGRRVALTVQFDYARSRLTWSCGLHPVVEPTGPLKTKRMLRPRRSLR